MSQRLLCLRLGLLLGLVALAGQSSAQNQAGNLVIKGGHVIDPRNQIDALMDVAIADGKIAAVRPGINPAEARTVVDVGGLYVTPATASTR